MVVPTSSQAGETLVESLISLSIMAIAVVAGLSGLISLQRTSHTVEVRSRADGLAAAYAEQLKQPVGVMAYLPCATLSGRGSYPAFAGTVPVGVTVEVISVEYLAGFDRGEANAPQWNSECDVDRGLQRITVEVRSGVGDTARIRKVSVIKRSARCVFSPAFENKDQGPC